MVGTVKVVLGRGVVVTGAAGMVTTGSGSLGTVAGGTVAVDCRAVVVGGDSSSGTVVVAEADGGIVCAGWIRFPRGTEFASLWGGGTLPEWRSRGIYRALVAYRARLAALRGVRYLYVDASPDSRPILERLGFVVVTMTTPYVWSPRGG